MPLEKIMNRTELKSLYKVMFTDYPDVVNVAQLCEMLGGVSVKTAYKLIQNGKIGAFMIGKAYRIPKMNIISFLSVPEKTVC